MTNIKLPKDAEGREIPLDTKILYNEDGKCFKVNRFTYSVVQTIPGLKWGVVFMDCRYDYCSSFHLTPPEPPDSWEELEEDLGSGADALNYEACAYFGMSACNCSSCIADKGGTCEKVAMRDILTRIRKLRGWGLMKAKRNIYLVMDYGGDEITRGTCRTWRSTMSSSPDTALRNIRSERRLLRARSLCATGTCTTFPPSAQSRFSLMSRPAKTPTAAPARTDSSAPCAATEWRMPTNTTSRERSTSASAAAERW